MNICPQCTGPVVFSRKRGRYWCAECETAFDGDTSPTPPSASDAPPRRMKIFLSYGRDEYVAEARALRDALQARGHEVWFDEGRLKGGRDWENQIEQGIRDCDRVVLTMTPYSVRRPDGYCLNELAKAMELQKTIIPVLLAPVPDGAPTSICRIQYLDWRDAVPATEQQERFSARLSRLCEAIEHDRLDFEGGQQRLKRHLRPLDFASDMQRHIARFQGRAGLFARIRAWLADPSSSQILWLSGPPGVGKSAIAAEISHRWEEGAAHHFCVAGHQDKSDPAKAVLSIAYQLSQRLDLYAVRLSNLELEQEAVKDAKTLFDNLLVGQLSRDFPAPPKPCLVVIDALDEATAPDGRNALAELIALDWRRLPPWIRLLITGRPEVEVQGWLGEADTLSLQGDDPEQVADLRSHVARELEAMGRPVRPETLDRIVERSEGAFQYVVLLLEDIRQGRCNPDDARDLPSGMGAYYRQTFQRRFPDVRTYQDRLRPLIALLLASPEPAPLAVLASVSGMTVAEIRRQLSQLGSMVTVSSAETGWGTDWDTARLAHATLASWLTAIDARTRLPSAAPYDVQDDTATLCDEVLRRWEARTSDAPAHPFVARVLWPLLMRGDQGDVMDRVAFDLSLYWKEKSDLTRALHLAEHSVRIVEVESSEGQERRVRRLGHLSVVYSALGRTSEALSMARDAVASAERLVQQDPVNADWQQSLCLSYLRVGEIYQAQGNREDNWAEYRKGLAIVERLVQQDPANPRWQICLSLFCDAFGLIYQYEDRGNPEDASAEYRKALYIRERFAQLEPANAHLQDHLSFSYSRVGSIYQDQGDLEGALAKYRKALAIAERLAQQDPANAKWQQTLGHSYHGIGGICEEQGDLEGALAEYRKALAIDERLAQQDPANAEWQQALGASYQRVGGIYEAQGNLAGALVVYTRNLAICERLAQQDPLNAFWRNNLNFSFDRVIRVYVVQGNFEGALQECRKKSVIVERLVQRDPANADWQHILGASCHRVGNIYESQGNLEGALAEHRKALSIAERLAQQEPANADRQRDLIYPHYCVGRIYESQGNLEGALAEHWKAISVAERLMQQEQSNADWLQLRTFSYNDVARIYESQGNLEDALQAYRKENAVVERLAKQDPVNAGRQEDLIFSYYEVARICESLGNLAGALVEYRKALAIAEHLIQQDPGNPGWQRDLGQTLQRMGVTLRGLGSYAESRDSFCGALEIFESLDGRRSDGVAFVLTGLGKLEALQGNHPAAATHFAEALDIRREVSPEDGEEIARLEQQLAAAREGRAPPPETGG